jgi:pimeloyl-ACP methyl ester carboxylesterase
VSRRVGVWVLVAVYVLAVVGSHVLTPGDDNTPNPEARSVQIPMPTADGLDTRANMRLSYFERGDPADARAPIIVLHGSPGRAAGFLYQPGPGEPSFLDRLAVDGRRVLAVDLPGFGNSEHWVQDYSARAGGRAVVALMDELGIERVHLVCWSNSGAAGIWMSDDTPDRLASLTLMAAVGAQETEGSGSYWFEHGKYALGMVFVEMLPEVVPHFGVLGSRSFRHTFIRSFLDTDQRPLAGIMRQTRVPTLILHGRNDFLISASAAEYHHDLMPSSRLVMMDAMHFLPFLHAQETADEILATAARHDVPGTPPLTGSDDRAPLVRLLGPSALVQRAGEAVRWWPWWVLVVLVAGLAWRMPETATLAAALFVSSGDLDFGVALVGLAAGRLMRGAEVPGTKGGTVAVLKRLVWALVSLMLGSIMAGQLLGLGLDAGGWLIVPGFVVGVLFLRLVRHGWTKTGRARIKAAITRTMRREWWPMWATYLPVVVALPVLAVKARHLLAFTACNPGIERGGGFVGESKSAILAKFPAEEERVLRSMAIGPGGRERAAAVIERIETDESLGGYPIIIKPDAGERGMGVRLAHGPEDLEAFLECEVGAAVVQRYHPGPHECGVFWMRKTKADDARPIGERDGFISSITLKEFQYLEGDGSHTIRRLIERHPRYRCQMRVFFERFADRLDEVLPAGERLLLSFAGSHTQGTRFSEGGHLRTPELESAINDIARSFADGGLDYGRFDIRYENEAELKAGRSFAVVEVNGTTSEPTNMYDDRHSALAAWRLLLGHWSQAYRIGGERIAAGGRALSAWRFLGLVLFRR